ncbi:hypothetical protein R3W88_025727 [Solanum pinnatisectum]|uniref:Ubiquitin-like domain-containing protein n=1 Tax=Solanum pinnatisectum TaxID=50273 RepID=A0AAV9M790_9SOLN|nr:hypothetical protein R3W88_025727 [Solanum pinnatisectum]
MLVQLVSYTFVVTVRAKYVDVDKMSYFELRDYIKELGYIVDCEYFIKWNGLLVLIDNDKVIFDLFNMINDGDIVEVYVFHGVSEANQAPLELEFVPNVSDSGVSGESFNEASNPNNQPPTSTFPSIPTTGLFEISSTSFELDYASTMKFALIVSHYKYDSTLHLTFSIKTSSQN